MITYIFSQLINTGYTNNINRPKELQLKQFKVTFNYIVCKGV